MSARPRIQKWPFDDNHGSRSRHLDIPEENSLKHPVRRSFVAGAASFLALRPILAQAELAVPEAEIARRLLAAVPALGDRSLGSEAAPVVVIEYTSPTCTYSAAFNETMLPGIRRDFIETGKLRLIFR